MSKEADKRFGQPHYGHDEVKFLDNGIIEVNGWRYKSMDDDSPVLEHTCQGCDEFCEEVYNDPRNPPLDLIPCLCIGCYEIALADLIDEAEQTLVHLSQKKDCLIKHKKVDRNKTCREQNDHYHKVEIEK